MRLGKYVADLQVEFDTLVANWHKRKKGFNRHDAVRLHREATANVLIHAYEGVTRPKQGRPRKEDQTSDEQELEDEQNFSGQK